MKLDYFEVFRKQAGTHSKFFMINESLIRNHVIRNFLHRNNVIRNFVSDPPTKGDCST